MSLFRYKGSLVWTMDFVFQGQRIRESTGTRNKELARRIERGRRLAEEEGRAGLAKPKTVRTFSAVADEYLVLEETGLTPGKKNGAARTLQIDRVNIRHHLRPYFGKLLLRDIHPLTVKKYQQARIGEGAAPTTVNNEMGTFRSITTRSGHWARLLPDINMLPVEYEVGISLTPEVEEAILEACSLSESRLLYPMVVLQLETGSRSGTVIRLPWHEVDFEGKGLRWGKDKTRAGTGRTIPISRRAMAVLEVWAENFPGRKPTHFVFPSETYRQSKGGQKGKVTTDPTKHVTSVQHSWTTALEKAGWILAGRPESLDGVAPVQCRFHDLRHTACTRMIQAGVPIPVIAQLVGWSATTMMAMAKKYGHFSQDELRRAVETISNSKSPVLSPAYSKDKTRHLS
jgi:integrase